MTKRFLIRLLICLIIFGPIPIPNPVLMDTDIVSSVEAAVIPVGIPTPAFGIDEVAPAITMYVNESSGSCNDANSGALITAPKCHLPTSTLAPGTHVRFIGDYTTGQNIRCGGTLANPVFLTGGNWLNGFDLAGTYCIMDGDAAISIHVTTLDGNDTHHVAVRNTPFDLSIAEGGLSVGTGTFTSGVSIDNVVFYNNYLHDNGDLENPDDNHCITIGSNGNSNEEVSYVYVLKSQMDRCSGDGVQVNAGQFSQWVNLHHIYLGGNTCSTNRQSCLWAKQSQQVVMARNFAQEMHVDVAGGNPGACYGSQYGSTTLYIFGNACINSDNCIIIAGHTGFGNGVAIIGNLCISIHADPGSDNDIDNAHAAGTCLAIRGGGVQIVTQNNTLIDCDGGLKVAPMGTVPVISWSNIFYGSDIVDYMYENSNNLSASTGYNLFYTAAHFNIDSTESFPSSGTLATSHSLIADPLFVNVGALNFHLQSGSPALSTGYQGTELETGYISIHGLSMGLDTTNIGALGGIGTTLLLR